MPGMYKLHPFNVQRQNVCIPELTENLLWFQMTHKDSGQTELWLFQHIIVSEWIYYVACILLCTLTLQMPGQKLTLVSALDPTLFMHKTWSGHLLETNS